MSRDTVTISIFGNIEDLEKLKIDIENKVVKKALDSEIVNGIERLKDQLTFHLKSPQVKLDELRTLEDKLHSAKKQREGVLKGEIEDPRADFLRKLGISSPSGQIEGTSIIRDTDKTSTLRIGTDVITSSTKATSSMPIADATIINAINKADLQKKNIRSEIGRITDSAAVVVLQKAGAAGGNVPPMYRRQAIPGESFKSAFNEAMEQFNKAIIAIINVDNTVSYFYNPGISLERFVKVHCSRSTDEGAQIKRFGDLSGREHIHWQLMSEPKKDTGNLEEFVRKNFVNITPVVDKVKDADTQGAKEVAEIILRNTPSTAKNVNFNQDEQYKNILEAIESVDKQKEEIPSLKLYTRLVETVKNMKAHKKLKNAGAEYSIVTGGTDPVSLDEFTTELRRVYLLWNLRERDFWVETINRAIQNVLAIHGIASVSSLSSKNKIV
jgi:hypothetical protein